MNTNRSPKSFIQEHITSFHPESDCIAVSGITGDLSIFKYPNEENKLEKTGQQPRWMDVEGGEDVEGEVV